MKIHKTILATGASLALTGIFGLANPASVNATEYTPATWTARTVLEVKHDLAQQESGSKYLLHWGDTLSVIAEATGVPVHKLVEINNIANRDLIFTGDYIYMSADHKVVTAGNGKDKKSYDVSKDKVVEVETPDEANASSDKESSTTNSNEKDSSDKETSNSDSEKNESSESSDNSSANNDSNKDSAQTTEGQDTVVSGVNYADIDMQPEAAFDKFMDLHPDSKVTEIKLDTKYDDLEYKIEGYDTDNEYQVRLDAVSGEVKSDDTKSLDSEDKNDGVISRDDVQKVNQLVDKAKKQAEKNTKFKKWSLEDNDGNLEFEIEYKDGNNKDVEYTYDVASGQLKEKGD